MKMRSIIIVAAIALIGGSEPPKSSLAVKVRRGYEESLKAADGQHRQSIKTADEAYFKALKVALDDALMAKNLTEANEIDAALKAIKEKTPPAAPQSKRMIEAMQTYKKAAEIADEVHLQRLKASDEEYLKQLQTALDAALEAKDLKEANRIDVTIKELKDIDRDRAQMDDNGVLIKVPGAGLAVTKGSFTAFTIPANPRPRETYSIVIELRLPAGVSEYRVSDILGEIRGSDGYTQKLPFDSDVPHAAGYPAENQKIKLIESSTILNVVNNRIQIIVKVPGAARLVKDVIRIRSKKLNEEQELTLVFDQAGEAKPKK